MSPFVEPFRASQQFAVRFCATYWRQLFIVAVASWFVSTTSYAAHAEPLPEPLLELPETLDSKSIVDPEVDPELDPEADSVAKGVIEPKIEPASDPDPDKAPALNTGVCAPDGVAVDGYDLVSYHTADAPQKGQQTIHAEHLGLTYHFASTQNRAAFVADPGQYLPSYRGWCSTNLSMGRLACPDYTNYKLEDGKLLFFERVGFTNGLDIWNSDPFRHRRQANQNFALLSGQ